MLDSFEILKALKSLNLLKNAPAWWWPNALKFEALLGVVLTQNTKFEAVLKSLENLKNAFILENDDEINLKKIAYIEFSRLAECVRPSGFYNQKAKRLIDLSGNILKDFQSFENFKQEVTREWLLDQKGIGKESADAVLCYVCAKEVMVVDKYSYLFLKKLGIEIEDYDELQNFFEKGVQENLNSALALYENTIPLAQLYARFHGKIVEFSKQKWELKL
ncbi:3-methyladenine DNA glycosylase [Helicobacter pylori]|uniref:3-methyladenine DNA glycosylase n=1 Tax=Helicobacter pylori TaxID=210 RepID=UPI00073D892D|nr:3-methyladenine DNA glycosylase [Helicobacter pylori]OKA00819.1 3-methyladenine DNA glycosylase [Helicobacter pylori]OKA02515.1 3-methyladenine DNA glycosylase [Helicobacter pylori]OMQ17273.1 3-methyladenine DNA glycosylase [Helicobacter pylori]OMQ17551.1 3-methyladenine DNA glycosylase [Helicobacter pylori]